MIFNNTIQTLCTNETAYPVLGVPETYITISNRSSRRKRQIDDYPTGIIRLANATLYCISYPQNPYDFQVLPCATADNIIMFCPSPSSASRILVVTHILDTEYKIMNRNI